MSESEFSELRKKDNNDLGAKNDVKKKVSKRPPAIFADKKETDRHLGQPVVVALYLSKSIAFSSWCVSVCPADIGGYLSALYPNSSRSSKATNYAFTAHEGGKP